MPIYEYRCEACGHEFEALQKMSDTPLSECPACAQATLKKILSAAGFRLKGSGWYETDFKKGKKKNIHDSGKSESKKPESKKTASKKTASKKTAASGSPN